MKASTCFNSFRPAINGQAVVTIINNVVADASVEYHITWFEDRNGNEAFYPDTDNILGFQSVFGQPQYRQSLDLTIDVSGNLLFRDNRIFFYVDSSQAIPESDEEDNLTHSMANCEVVPVVGEFNPVLWRCQQDLGQHPQNLEPAYLPHHKCQ